MKKYTTIYISWRIYKNIYNTFKNSTLADTSSHIVGKNTTLYKTYGEPIVKLFGLDNIKFDFGYEVTKGKFIAHIIYQHQMECTIFAEDGCLNVYIHTLARKSVKSIIEDKCEDMGFIKEYELDSYNIYTFKIE